MNDIKRNQDSGLVKSPKQILWEKQTTLLNEIKDDRPIDENIKETLVALNVLGIHTEASCGGHPFEERHAGDTPYPWILFSSPDEPTDKLPKGHVDWNKGNASAVLAKLQVLLAEFYAGRQVDREVKLRTSDVKFGQFRLSSVDDKNLLDRLSRGELTDVDKSDLVSKLPRRQQEMSEFGTFLKSKFFALES